MSKVLSNADLVLERNAARQRVHDWVMSEYAAGRHPVRLEDALGYKRWRDIDAEVIRRGLAGEMQPHEDAG